MAASSSEADFCLRCEKTIQGRARNIPAGIAENEFPFQGSKPRIICSTCHILINVKKTALPTITPETATVTPTKNQGRPLNHIGLGSPPTKNAQFVREVERAGGFVEKQGMGHWELCIPFKEERIKKGKFRAGNFKILLARGTGCYFISIEKTLFSSPQQFNLLPSFHKMNEENVFKVLQAVKAKLGSKIICRSRCTKVSIFERSSEITVHHKSALGLRTAVIKNHDDTVLIVGEGSNMEEQSYWWRSSKCNGFVDESSPQKCSSCSHCCALRQEIYRPSTGKRKTVNSQPSIVDPQQYPDNRSLADLVGAFQQANFAGSLLPKPADDDNTDGGILGLFLKNALSHLGNQRGTRWDPALLSWAVNILVQAGEKGYEALRKSKHHDGLPLPSLSTLRRKIRLVSSEPGIDKTACQIFRDRMRADNEQDAVISFDEIYLVSGLRLIRTDDGYGIIGFTVGKQRVDCREIITIDPSTVSEDIRSQLNRPQTVPDTDADPAGDPSSKDPSPANFMIPVQCPEAQSPPLNPPAGGWKPLRLWSDSSTVDRSEDKVRMALHFFVASVSSHLSTSAGYFEVSSINYLDLHHYVNLVIMGVLKGDSKLLRSNELRFLQRKQGKIEMPNPFFEYPNSSKGDKLRVVALCFDGSSHARTFAHTFGGSTRLYRDGQVWGKRSIEKVKILGLEHPLQHDPILLIGDLVHMLKRCRNSVMKSKGYLFDSPSPEVISGLVTQIKTLPPDQRSQCLASFWSFHSARVGSELYSEILLNDQTFPLSISRLTESCIALTSRSKMSYPLAKRALSSRVRLALDSLPPLAPIEPPIELMKRQNLARYLGLMQSLMQLRKTTQISRPLLIRMISETLNGIESWKACNAFYHHQLVAVDEFLDLPDKHRFVSKGTSHHDVFGFLHWDLYYDLKTMLFGFKSLLSLPAVHPKLVTTDVIESFFSTLRAGRGSLTVDAHRSAYRKGKICRIGDRISYLSSLEIRESTLTIQALLDYYQDKHMSDDFVVLRNEPVLPPLSLPKPFDWTDLACWEATLLPPQVLHYNYLAGWLLSKQLKKYSKTSALPFLLAERHPESSREETFASKRFCSFAFAMVYICHHLIGDQTLAYPNLHKRLTQECEVLLSTWIVPEHTGLMKVSFQDATRRFCAMFLADRLRNSGMAAAHGNLTMRVQVLIKQNPKQVPQSIPTTSVVRSDPPQSSQSPPTRSRVTRKRPAIAPSPSIYCTAPGCSEHFRSLVTAQQHLLTHFPSLKTDYHCQLCDGAITFPSLQDHQDHMDERHNMTSKRQCKR